MKKEKSIGGANENNSERTRRSGSKVSFLEHSSLNCSTYTLKHIRGPSEQVPDSLRRNVKVFRTLNSSA